MDNKGGYRNDHSDNDIYNVHSNNYRDNNNIGDVTDNGLCKCYFAFQAFFFGGAVVVMGAVTLA